MVAPTDGELEVIRVVLGQLPIFSINETQSFVASFLVSDGSMNRPCLLLKAENCCESAFSLEPMPMVLVKPHINGATNLLLKLINTASLRVKIKFTFCWIESQSHRNSFVVG